MDMTSVNFNTQTYNNTHVTFFSGYLLDNPSALYCPTLDYVLRTYSFC